MKKYITMLIITSLLILSGCSSNSDGTKNNEGQPGAEYNKAQSFNFGFVIKNFQNHDLTDLKIKISGVEWGYINGLEKDYTIAQIPKATVQTGPGVYSNLYVQGISLDKFTNKYNFNPKFDYCYTAKTAYREQVCILSKTTNACNIKVDASTYQNGPLSVKIINLRNYDPQTIIVDFQVTNSLSGKVVNECFKTDDYANEYKINTVTLGTIEGDCSKTVDKKIIGNNAVITCTFPRGAGDEAYPSQLVMELEYKYEQSVQKNILIKDYTAQTN